MESPHTHWPILLLEDDADVFEATRLLLEEEGFEVLGATSLSEALEVAVAAQHCLVLLDLSLPGDPAAFVGALRGSAWQGQVVLFSAGERLAERAAAMGADGVLRKPFDIDSLLAELRARASAPEPPDVRAQ